ncbi:unnamed protein product [Adineta ricciae]|uniref:Uncharacterized protein n=1 Tax=Adineta ricciae TaxID=249248 RepID=A0A815P297_ADIRI|nr:unnamed protein product [Adineta ricciae]
MAAKRITPRTLLQRVFTVAKQTNDQQTSTNLTVPSYGRNWQREISTTYSDVTSTVPILLMPTYALGPQKKFDFCRAQKILQLELNRRCNRVPKSIRYEPKLCVDLARDLAHQLRRVLKPEYLNTPRYKIIVVVSIVQAAPNRQIHQEITIASRCLWDRDTDGSLTVRSNFGRDIIAVATAFIVYTE